MRHRLPALLLVVGFALVAHCPSAVGQTQPIQYGYDELGRLVVVVDATGKMAIYNYDAVGNLTSIQRADADTIPGPVAITLVTPTRGKVGTVVSLFGC